MVEAVELETQEEVTPPAPTEPVTVVTTTEVVSVVEPSVVETSVSTVNIADTMQKVLATLDASDYEGNTKLLLDLIVDFLSSRTIERQHQLFDILTTRVNAIDSLKLTVV